MPCSAPIWLTATSRPSVSANLSQRHQEHERRQRQQQPGPLNLSYEVDLWGRLAAARSCPLGSTGQRTDRPPPLLLIGKTLEQYWQLAYLGSAITLGTSNWPIWRH
jgi:hypothetical protein